jgi:peptidoglycan-N-acetylglucosamine deacetylase
VSTIFKTVILKGRTIRRVLLLAVIMALVVVLCLKLEVPERVVQVVNRPERLVPIYYVETEEKKIAISFDASWGAERTEGILATLRENDLKTTFFLTGFWVEKYPDMVKKIAEDGHEIGNHTYSHPHLNNLGEKEIEQEVQKVHDLIKELTGSDPVLFRPPFGEYSNKVVKVLDRMEYKTIQWSVDSLDWKDLGKEEIVNRVLSGLHEGAIVLFHNNGKFTAEALPDIIRGAEEKGYRIVPISKLLYQDNYYIDSNSGAQIQKP